MYGENIQVNLDIFHLNCCITSVYRKQNTVPLDSYPYFFLSLQIKPKGVSGLIEIENPNRVAQKMKKASDVQLNDDTSSQLSRRERYYNCDNLIVLYHMLDTKKCLELTKMNYIYSIS